MNIFVDENIPYLADALRPCGDVTSFSGRELTNSSLIDSECKVLFVRSTTKVNEKLLKGTDVEFLGTATAGFDHVNLGYLNEHNIQFVSAPGANSNSVAELVVYSILKWSDINQINLENKSIGIIGYGNIGKKAAHYANNMGLKVIVNDPPLKDEQFDFPGDVQYRELNELLNESDIITNHVPLNKSGKYKTVGLIDKAELDRIKSDALFIHASRGSVLVEKALLEKISNSNITSVIDVFENEPYISKNVVEAAILTSPHVGGYSRNGKLNGSMMMMKNFERYSGLKPDYSAIEAELSSYTIDNSYVIYNEDKTVKTYHSEKLLNILRKSRNFEYDTKLLKESMKLDKETRAKSFDLMRKQYPKRWENMRIITK